MNRNPTNYGSITDPVVGFSGGNSAGEFKRLYDDLDAKIFSINTNMKKLQDILKLIGTPKYNIDVRNNIHEIQQSTNEIASVLTKDISKLKSNLPRNDKQKQLLVEKLEEIFCDTLNKYYRLQKDLVDKQKAHLLVSVSIEHNTSDDEDKDYQIEAQITKDLEFEQQIMLEREESMRRIEGDVLNINELMRELASRTHDQEQQIESLGSHIDHTVGNIEAGTEQIIKSSNYLSRYRKKILILVVICIIIASIVIGIIVSSVKK